LYEEDQSKCAVLVIRKNWHSGGQVFTGMSEKSAFFEDTSAPAKLLGKPEEQQVYFPLSWASGAQDINLLGVLPIKIRPDLSGSLKQKWAPACVASATGPRYITFLRLLFKSFRLTRRPPASRETIIAPKRTNLKLRMHP
jgi:hypothetical protein